MTVAVRPEWLARGDVIELAIPRRLECARCEGGGCDACARSGAIRPSPEQGRVQVGLPKNARAPLLVRLARPLGPDAGLEQLVVEVRVGAEPTPGCRPLPAERARPPRAAGGVALAVTIALALAAFAGALALD